MKYEIKISLPVYKIIYAAFFVMILSIVRGVTYSYEIGIALEAPMAILAAVFCADAYTQEITAKRSEVQRLYPMKKRIYSVFRRMMIQEIFLVLLAVIGYGLFFLFQHPRVSEMGQENPESEISRFLLYFAAIVINLGFWGLLSNLLSCILRNMWMGIGGCVILWVFTNSGVGDRYLGVWNLFSYTFRNIENSGDFSWMYGKVICAGIGIIAAAILPGIIKKRG